MHENGSISVYERHPNQNKKQDHKKDESLDNIIDKLHLNFVYQLCYQSDPVRLVKSARINGFSVCPSTQKHLAVIINDGRLLKYEVLKKQQIKNKTSLKEVIKDHNDNFLMDLFDEDSKCSIKMVLESYNLGQADMITNVTKMFNPLNEECTQPLLAIGGASGLIIYNVEQNLIDKKLTIFNNSSVNGIEWITINSLILWSSPTNESTFVSNENSSQSVKNEIILLDIRTGINSLIKLS